jgi:hypothetical protein
MGSRIEGTGSAYWGDQNQTIPQNLKDDFSKLIVAPFGGFVFDNTGILPKPPPDVTVDGLKEDMTILNQNISQMKQEIETSSLPNKQKLALQQSLDQLDQLIAKTTGASVSLVTNAKILEAIQNQHLEPSENLMDVLNQETETQTPVFLDNFAAAKSIAANLTQIFS